MDFWLAYIAYAAAVATIGVFYRFGELVVTLGGSARLLGLIVAIGSLFGLSARVRLMAWSDKRGPRFLWLLSLLSMGAGSLLLALPHPPMILLFAGRGLFSAGASGGLALPIIYVQKTTPSETRGAAMGLLSGGYYVGLVVGVLLSEWIPLQFLFVAAAGVCAVGAGATLWIIARGTPLTFSALPTAGHKIGGQIAGTVATPRWPKKPILAAAFALGYAFTFCTVFMTRYLNVTGIGGFLWFFFAYCLAAFAVSSSTKSWGKAVGNYRLVLLGVTFYVFGDLLLLTASQSWHLIFPGIALGASRALLYPALVAMAEKLEARTVSGNATNQVSLMMDSGILVAAVTMGLLIESAGYSWTIALAAAVVLLAGAVFAWKEASAALPQHFRRRKDDHRSRRKSDFSAGLWTGEAARVSLVFVRLANGMRLDGALHRPRDPRPHAAPHAATPGRASVAPPGRPGHVAVLIHADGDDFCSPSVLETVQNYYLDQGTPVLRVNTSGKGVINVYDFQQTQVRHGSAFEVVQDSVAELDAWVDWLKRQSFSRFSLVGHRLGAVKALYYAISCGDPAAIESVVAMAPPRLSNSFIASHVKDGTFEQDVERARLLIQGGQPMELFQVRHPNVEVTSAQAYFDKFGQEERYNVMRIATKLACPTLFLLAGADDKTLITTRDLGRDLRKLAQEHANLHVSTVEGANHYFTNMREWAVTCIDEWQRQRVVTQKDQETPRVAAS